MKKSNLKLVILTKLFFSFQIAFVQQVYGSNQVYGFRNPLKADSFAEFIDYIIGFLWEFGLILVVLIIIIGAFHMITSTGDPEKFKKGINVIKYAFIGLLVIIMAAGLVNMIMDLVAP